MRTVQAAGGGTGPAFRPLDIVLACAVGATFLVAVFAYMKIGDASKGVARLRGEVRDLTGRLDTMGSTAAAATDKARIAEAEVAALRRKVEALESRPAAAPEVSPAELAAAVDAALERRREAFVGDMNRRGEEMAADIAAQVARRIDLQGLGGDMKKTAENLRRGGEEGKERERTEGEKKADDAAAKGFDAAAEGIELFRKLQNGEITNEEFRQKTRELRERVQKEFEGLTPEEQDALRERFGGFGRRRNRPGGGEGQGAGEGEGARENF